MNTTQPKKHLRDLYRINFASMSREGCLRLDMNENVIGLPKDFIKGIFSEIDADFLSSYPQYHRLEARIARYNSLAPGNICLSNGSDAAIKYIFDAYIYPKDRVLLTDPTFAMYPVYCKISAALPIEVEYNDFSFPFERFYSLLSPKLKLVVLVNPHNPTGTLLEKTQLMKIIEKTAKDGVLLIVDEAYFGFSSYSVIKEVRRHKNLIVLRTFSKLSAMASARVGYAVSCPEIIENLRKVKPTFDVNGLGVCLAERLLTEPKIIQGFKKEIRQGKKYLIDKLSIEGIPYRQGYANFILINCPGRVGEVIKNLAKRGILVQGSFKQAFLKDYIRVTIGSREVMQIFWRAFIEIWKSKNAR